MTSTSRRVWALAIVGTLGLSLAAGARAQTSTDPMQTCTPEQLRATQRYWFSGNRLAIDFGVSGSSHTVSANPSTVGNIAEGSTVVTDTNGTLQFWVGGGQVYNRNQVVMDNGGGIDGNLSSVQVVTAFAAPTLPGRYFIVATTGNADGGAGNTPGNLLYSVVDMTANGGLGAVTTKNLVFATGVSSEALTSVPSSDGLGMWVITAQYGSNVLNAVRFDNNGPVGAPVASTLSQSVGQWYGSLYFNPQLNRLAYLNGHTNAVNYAHLLTFNASTGTASELAAWRVPVAGATDPNNSAGTRRGYAADFSPSGQYLYVSQIYPGRLWRYDVSSDTATTIGATEEYIGWTGASDTSNGGGHIRRGPDGAMWIANQTANNTITRIPDPDAATVADIGFVRNNIALAAGSNSVWGLPQTAAGCPRAMEPDAMPVIVTPAVPVAVGSSQPVTVTFSNEGTLGDVVDGTATISLPPGVRLDGAPPAGCTAAPAAATDPQVISCELSTSGIGSMVPGASIPVSFQVIVSTPGTYTIDVAITGVTDEVNIGNNTTAGPITAIAEPVVREPALPVPAATPLGLALMALLLSGLGFMRRRRG